MFLSTPRPTTHETRPTRTRTPSPTSPEQTRALQRFFVGVRVRVRVGAWSVERGRGASGDEKHHSPRGCLQTLSKSSTSLSFHFVPEPVPMPDPKQRASGMGMGSGTMRTEFEDTP